MVWLAGWGYRKSHLITASAGAGTNYQVGIKVYKTTGTDGTETVNGATMGKVYVGVHCRDDFGDIRFTDNDETTELDYWMESSTSGVSAVFWVEVRDTLESDATIFVYYGKSDATTTSNGVNTFLLFDHFLGETLNTDLWNSAGTPVVGSGKVTITGTAGEEIASKNSYGKGTAIRASGQLDSTSGGGQPVIGYQNDIQDTNVVELFTYNSSGNYTGYTKTAGGTSGGIDTGIADTTTCIMNIEWAADNLVKFQVSTSNLLSYTNSAKIPTGTYPINIYCRFINDFAAFDWIVVRKYVGTEPVHSTWGSEESVYRITGVTRNSAGVILGSCTVLLYKTSDHSYVTSMTSDADTGEYSFALDNSAEYFVVAFKSGTPNVQGVTDDDLVGA
jgi:hypothetical protein